MEIIRYDICDSTNLRAKEYVKQNKIDRAVFIANAQSQGRGRQGKSFYSPENTGIYMTYVFRADMPLYSAVSVTTYAAAAVCKALETVSAKDLQIKWVNDIYLEGKKICGILAESVMDSKSKNVEYVIIGVGVNVTTSEFPDDIKDIASSLGDVDKQKIIDAIISGFDEIADNPTDRKFMEYYRQKSMVLGKEITVISKSGTRYATAISVDDDGGLKIRLSNGTEEILNSGEISLKIAK